MQVTVQAHSSAQSKVKRHSSSGKPSDIRLDVYMPSSKQLEKGYTQRRDFAGQVERVPTSEGDATKTLLLVREYKAEQESKRELYKGSGFQHRFPMFLTLLFLGLVSHFLWPFAVLCLVFFPGLPDQFYSGFLRVFLLRR